MGALTEVYLDPSIAADSGSGTSGDPYGDLQYALDQVTRDSTNGNRFNIKAGTDEVLTGALSLTTYGTPTLGAPIVFQGYTSSAGDGGQGGISGNGSNAVISTTADGVHFKDMHLHNCGAADILTLDRFNSVVDCELDDTTGSAIVLNDESAHVIGCNIHNIGTYGVLADSSQTVLHNYFANGTNDFTDAIRVENRMVFVSRNIISIDGSSNGINFSNTNVFGNVCTHNSILAASGTGKGIHFERQINIGVLNNLVEGFSGAGGVGIALDASSDNALILAGNAVYNCTTDYADKGDINIEDDNESLGSSPFAKSGSDTFANRFTYFAPADVGNVIGGAYS